MKNNINLEQFGQLLSKLWKTAKWIVITAVIALLGLIFIF